MERKQKILRVLHLGWRGIEILDILASLGGTAVVRGILGHVVSEWAWYNQLFLFGGILLIFIVLVVQFSPLIRNWITGKVQGHSSSTETQTTVQPITIAEPRVQDLRTSIQSARVVWGRCHSGNRLMDERLFDFDNVKRLLLLSADEDNKALEHIVELSNDKMDSTISRIRDTTKEAIERGVEVKWHREYRDTSIMIYDTQPKAKAGKLIPSSDEAYITVQVLEPQVGRDERHIYRINNQGKQGKRFSDHFDDFIDIWENKSRKPRPEEYGEQ